MQKNKVVTFKNKHEIKCYKNCPYSPNLSIIETVWCILKQYICKHRYKTKDELAEMIQYKWRKITQAKINKLVLQMEERIQAVLNVRGLIMPY